jgi:hypothetical protein
MSSEKENVGSQGADECVEMAVEEKLEEAAEPSNSSAHRHSLTTAIIGFTLLNTALAA